MIDSKRGYRGNVAVTNPLFGSAKLTIAGRDQTKLVAGVEKQVTTLISVAGSFLCAPARCDHRDLAGRTILLLAAGRRRGRFLCAPARCDHRDLAGRALRLRSPCSGAVFLVGARAARIAPVRARAGGLLRRGSGRRCPRLRLGGSRNRFGHRRFRVVVAAGRKTEHDEGRHSEKYAESFDRVLLQVNIVGALGPWMPE